MLTVAPSLLENLGSGYDHRLCGDDKPCLWIRTLISGLGRESRERRRYLMLQTAFDDSGKDAASTSFTLAGYFGSPGQLMDFAHDWDDELRRHHSLAYVKGYEAFGLHTQFGGWIEKDRDERLLKFARLIARHKLKGIAFVIDNEPFSLIAGLKDDDGNYFKKPDKFAYLTAFSFFLQALPDFGENAVDMVFDYEVVSRREAIEAYTKIKTEPEWEELSTRLFRPEPHWETDNDFLPLQAADLLAYCVRAERDTGKRRDKVLRSPLLPALKSIRTGIVVVGETYLEYLRNKQAGCVSPKVELKMDLWTPLESGISYFL